MATHKENQADAPPTAQAPITDLSVFGNVALYGIVVGAADGAIAIRDTLLQGDALAKHLGESIALTVLILTVLTLAEVIGARFVGKRPIAWGAVARVVRFWLLIGLIHCSVLLTASRLGWPRQAGPWIGGIVGALWGLLFGWWEYILAKRNGGKRDVRPLCREFDVGIRGAFVRLWQLLAWVFVLSLQLLAPKFETLRRKLETLEKKYDAQVKVVFDALHRSKPHGRGNGKR